MGQADLVVGLNAGFEMSVTQLKCCSVRAFFYADYLNLQYCSVSLHGIWLLSSAAEPNHLCMTNSTLTTVLVVADRQLRGFVQVSVLWTNRESGSLLQAPIAVHGL